MSSNQYDFLDLYVNGDSLRYFDSFGVEYIPKDIKKSRIKAKLPKVLLSGIVYKYKRSGCNATYYGKTKRHFEVQICQYFVISHLTGENVRIDNNKLTEIQEHLLCCSYFPKTLLVLSFSTREGNNFKLKLMDGLLTARDNPVLNKADSSLSLELF